jgi:hypothetical protein
VKYHIIRKQLARKVDHDTRVLAAVRGVQELVTPGRIPTKSTGLQMIFVMEAACPHVVEHEVLADVSTGIA